MIDFLRSVVHRNSLLAIIGSIAAGGTLGYLASLPVYGARLNRWQSDQASVALQDLQLLERLSNTTEGTLDRDVERLAAKGEIRWERISEIGNSPSVAWTMEPNRFWKLRVSATWKIPEGGLRSASMVRRFPESDIQKSIGDGTLSLVLGSVFGAALALVLLYQRHAIQAQLRWLQSLLSSLKQGKFRTGAVPSDAIAPRIVHGVYAIADSMHKQVETVRASHENSSHAMTEMPIGIVSFDDSLALNFINPAGKGFLGIGKAELGRKMNDLIRVPILLDCIEDTHRTGKATEVEYERVAEKQWLRLRTYPLTSRRPNETNPASMASEEARFPVLLTVIDETRIKQLENLRRDFTANVSHELKTPLSAIKAYAETLLMGAAEDPDARQRFIERISEQAARLDTLIRDLLQLTRLQSQPQKPKLYPLNIHDVVQAAIEDHRPIADQRNVTLECDGMEDCSVRSDLESLQTVVSNLLSNAIRYNREGGKVEIKIELAGDDCIVAFSDTGIGIPASDIDRIFERFYRVEKARSQDLGGTGLGLAIVKHLCQSIAADISVQSRIGEGSTFKLKLPRAR